MESLEIEEGSVPRRGHQKPGVPTHFLVIASVVFVAVLVWAIVVTVQKSNRAPVIETEIFATKPADFAMFHFNDVYLLNPATKTTNGGPAKAATFLRNLRSEFQDRTIVTLGGDLISPSVESTIFKGQQMVEMMNAMNLTAAVLGNHEFDMGLDVMYKAFNTSSFPWMISNMKLSDGSPLPYTKDDVRMTVTTPNAGEVTVCMFGLIYDLFESGYKTGGVVYQNNILMGIQKARALKNSGCDLVVLVSHQLLTDDCVLSHASDDIDIILGGHEHQSMYEANCGKSKYYKSSSDFQDVWSLKIWLSRVNGKVTIDNVYAENNVVTPSTPEMPEVQSIANFWSALLSAKFDVVIGNSLNQLNGKTLDSRTKETGFGSFASDALRILMGTDIAMINGGNIRSDTIYPPGPTKRRVLVAMLPFLNYVVSFQITGKQLRDHLVWAVSGVPLVAGQFAQVGGFRFVWRQTVTATSLTTFDILSLTRTDNTPIVDTDIFSCATADFYHSSSPVLAPLPLTATSGMLMPELIESYIAKFPGGVFNATTDGRIIRQVA